ncbi:glutamyl aminopeptidase-like isoform X2 [Temnothorax americanus]|uniref:glutamyl aminopeptidase-like isoform X2 n=1 Tax=Temnothorax americanus TaxID=1964332 RepID=UPI004068939C
MNLAQISSSLIFITTIAIVTGKELNNPSFKTQFYLPFPELGVFPVHYAIRLTALIEKYDLYMTQPSDIKQEYSSILPYIKSSITINIIQSTHKIRLHTLNIHNSGITLTGRNNNDNIPYAVREIEYISETNILEIYFSDILYPGVYSLTLDSRGQNTENVFKSSYINREKRESIMYLFAPHIQVGGARRLFPCWDEPHFKTTFAISVKHHRNLTALSNMPLKVQDKDNDDLVWTYFHTTPPISTYQVSIILTNFNHILIKENIIKLWYKTGSILQSLKYAKQVIKNITVHLESEFYGIKIKIPKMDHVAIPNFPHDGTSKWGLIFHREEDLIYDERLDTVMRKIEIAHSLAPKIAYQWLGNAITPSSWTDFWLHNGLAVLFGEEAIAKVFNNSEIMGLFIVQTQYHSLHLDSHFDMNPPRINSLSEIDSIFGSVNYMKVIIVLRMLQNEITDKMFREGVRTLLRNYMSTPLTPNNFWDIYIQRNLTKAYYYNISPDFQKWIIYRHYPIINWTQKNPQIRTLTQYCVNTTSYGKWWIPVSLITKIFVVGVINILLTPQEPSKNIKYFEYSAEDDRIIVDIQQAGYYRVNYETNNWRKIAYYLNSGEYKDVSAINRAKIIDDAFYFMMTRKINSSIFWELTKYLSRETDYVAWYPMFKVFEYISSVFPLTNNNINFIHIKERMRELLAKSLEILGFEDRPMESDFTKCLRQEIVKWRHTLERSNKTECNKERHQNLYQNCPFHYCKLC